MSIKPGSRVRLARIIGLLPLNFLRCFLYRLVFGYRIENSFIGRSVVLAVENADLSGCTITSGNKFIGPMSITIKPGAYIEPDNKFQCGWWTISAGLKDVGYERCLIIGHDTLITSCHYFDVAGSFTLGDRSWVAGRGSQFWTHGAGSENRVIEVGPGCYIGSAVRFSPGSCVGENTLVALGSVVTRSFSNNSHVVVGGNPATIIRDNYDWKKREKI